MAGTTAQRPGPQQTCYCSPYSSRGCREGGRARAHRWPGARRHGPPKNLSGFPQRQQGLPRAAGRVRTNGQVLGVPGRDAAHAQDGRPRQPEAQALEVEALYHCRRALAHEGLELRAYQVAQRRVEGGPQHAQRVIQEPGWQQAIQNRSASEGRAAAEDWAAGASALTLRARSPRTAAPAGTHRQRACKRMVGSSACICSQTWQCKVPGGQRRTLTQAGRFFSTNCRPSSSSCVTSRTAAAKRARRHARTPASPRPGPSAACIERSAGPWVAAAAPGAGTHRRQTARR